MKKFILVSVLIANFYFLSAQQSRFIQIPLKELAELFRSDVCIISKFLVDDFTKDKLKIFSNRVDKVVLSVDMLDSINSIKSLPIKSFNGEMTFLNETIDIHYVNAIKIYEDGLEFIFRTKYSFNDSYPDTDIVVYYIPSIEIRNSSNNQVKMIYSFLYDDLFKNGILEFDMKIAISLIARIQIEMFSERNRSMIFTKEKGYIEQDDSLRKVLRESYIISFQDLNKLNELDYNHIYSSPVVIDYYLNSKKGKIRINAVGFGVVPKDGYLAGVSYPYNFYYLKQKYFKSALSQISNSTLHKLIDSYLCR